MQLQNDNETTAWNLRSDVTPTSYDMTNYSHTITVVDRHKSGERLVGHKFVITRNTHLKLTKTLKQRVCETSKTLIFQKRDFFLHVRLNSNTT